MKYYFLIAALFLCAIKVNAQKIKFEGQVIDSTGAALELANVVAERKDDGVIASFGVTDSEGRFYLDLENKTTYLLKSSFIGFENFEKEIIPGEVKQPFKIVLKSKATQLETLEIIEEYPVVITDDTITYKADAFTKGNERKLEDVLEAIPGFEVDENGEVKVQGKSVEKVLVDGKEFFEGDSKLATKNIPANAVDKVQLLRNFNDVAPLGGVNSEDRLALNIKLKEGKKEMVFGDVEGGAGNSQRYLGHANLFYYNPKLNINLIADANNIGQPAFTPRDYFRFSGGFRSLASRNGSGVQISQSDLSFLGVNSRSAEQIESNLNALNFNYVPNKKWSFSGFAIASMTNSDFSNASSRTYLTEGSTLNEEQKSSTSQDMKSGLLKFTAKYTPNDKWHISTESMLKLSEMSSQFDQVSFVNDNLNNDLSNNQGQRPYSFNQNLSAYFAPDDKNIFSVENRLEYGLQDPLLQLNGQLPLFLGTLPENTTDILQQQETRSLKQETLVNYYRVLNATNHINLLAGINYLDQDFSSDLIINEDEQTPGFDNKVNFGLQDNFIGLGLKSKQGKFVFYPSVSYHYFTSENEQSVQEDKFSRDVILPKLNVKFDIDNNQSIVLDYSKNLDFFTVENLYNNSLIENYNLLKRGNPQLRNGTYHNLSLNYMNFNMFSFFNIYGGLNYQYRIDDVSNRLSFSGIDRELVPFNLSEANEIASGNINFSKTFLKWKLNAGTNSSYSRRYNAFENQLSLNESLMNNYNLSIETKLFKKLIIEVGYRHMNNRYQGDRSDVTYITKNPFATIDFTFLKSFHISAEYEYFDYSNEQGTNKTTYSFLTARLTYHKEDSPWSVNLKGLNLLNTVEIRNDNFSDNLIQTNARTVQPLYWTMTFLYEL